MEKGRWDEPRPARKFKIFFSFPLGACPDVAAQLFNAMSVFVAGHTHG